MLISCKGLLLLPAFHGNVRLFNTLPHQNVTIRELMKLLHPDLFALSDPAIQTTNITCIQNVQEIMGFLHETSSQWKENSHQNEILIKSPLRSSYELKCFIRGKDEDISMLSVAVHSPTSLCERVVTTQQHLHRPLLQLIEQFSKLWNYLPINNPWREVLQRHEKKEKKIHHHTEISQGIIDELGSSLFDSAVTLKHQQTRRDGVANIFSTIDTSPRRRKNKKHLSKLADWYVVSGNVRFNNVHIAEESSALVKFRSFLLDYGDLVNFNAESWSKIFIVMQNPSADTNDHYCVTTLKQGYFIVNMPVKFSTEKVLELLQSEIPSCLLL